MVGRKKLGRTSLRARVAPGTPEAIKALALALGFEYGHDGAIGQLFDAIASGEVLLVQKKAKP
jgi:hypothetical protein